MRLIFRRACLALAPALCLAGAASAASVAGVEIPPPPAPCPVTDLHWSVAVVDPYRCLENTADESVQKLMRAQADATTAILAKIPGRDRLLKRIEEIDAEIPAAVTKVHRDERGGLFYMKREARDNQFKLYYRASMDGAERVLADPDAEAKATGKPHAIADYNATRDGKLLAYSISAGGAEIGVLRVIEVATGKEVMPPIDRIRGGDVSWLDDGSGFFFSRLAEGYEKRPRAERFMDHHAYLRKIGDTRDTPVFGPGLFPEVTIERSANGHVFLVPDQPLAGALVAHGVDRNVSFYLTDRESLLAGKPKWRKVFDQSAQVAGGTTAGGWMYLRSAKDAPRYKVLRVKLPEADLAKAETLVAPSGDVVTDIAAAAEGLYMTRREGAAKKLFRIAHAPGSKPEPITLPFEGNVGLTDLDPRLPGAIISLSGWTRGARHYALGARDTRPVALALAPTGKYEVLSGVVAREVKVKSHDGVEVPVSIIARADLKLDGRNPAQLYGYAAYGIVEEPALNARILAWLEQGGVYVYAHARGGGINGDEWHRAGWKTTKPNTWKDGIAVAEWLIANGYTSKERLAIYGGSAGAIFVGRAVTERPDLFSAAVIGVGNTDQLRSETRANGAGNIPEYGTFMIEEEFKALAAMSTYANVKEGAKYPPVMFEHGVNDSRVDVWMTLKTGSRMAAATSSGKPVLMRLEYDGGHGVGATRSQAASRTADRWAFFLWHAGVPEFQPQP